MLNSLFSRVGASLLTVIALTGVAPVLHSVPSAETDAQHWVAAKFVGELQAELRQGYLIVHQASGTVLKNEVKGHTLRIANTQYRRGINTSVGTGHGAPPRPGTSFAAVVGADSNDVGYYSNAERGSVVLRWKSPARRPLLQE
jgi:hypothetical protein